MLSGRLRWDPPPMQHSGAAPLIRRAILSKKTPKATGNRGTLKMMGEKVGWRFWRPQH